MSSDKNELMTCPVVRYLGALCWDGSPRVDTWLSDFVGVEPSPRARTIGAKWLISGVARAFEPGCNIDGVLVLEGKSGIGKSRVLQALGGEWHREFDDDVRMAPEQIRGAWICELSEAPWSRYRADGLKAFLARRADRFRPMYSVNIVEERRRCVFAMTTDHLPAIGASRRWWHVRCLARADVETLAVERDQLWAEAVVRYRGGERWWLELDELEDEVADLGGLSGSNARAAVARVLDPGCKHDCVLVLEGERGGKKSTRRAAR